jgi:hypothetical protein
MSWFRRSPSTQHVDASTVSTVPACCSAHRALYGVDHDVMHGWYVECYHAHVHGAFLDRAVLTDDYSSIMFRDGSFWCYGPRADGTYGYTARCRA